MRIEWFGIAALGIEILLGLAQWKWSVMPDHVFYPLFVIVLVVTLAATARGTFGWWRPEAASRITEPSKTGRTIIRPRFDSWVNEAEIEVQNMNSARRLAVQVTSICTSSGRPIGRMGNPFPYYLRWNDNANKLERDLEYGETGVVKVARLTPSFNGLGEHQRPEITFDSTRGVVRYDIHQQDEETLIMEGTLLHVGRDEGGQPIKLDLRFNDVMILDFRLSNEG